MAERIRILLAEHDDADANRLESALHNISDISMECERIRSFKEIANFSTSESFDGILLNLELPDFSGSDLLKSIKEIFPEIPVVVLVKADEDQKALKDIRQGAQGFIRLNTLNIDEVAVVIYQAFERQNALNEVKESQRQLANLVSNLPGIVYRCLNDPDWTMEYISQGCLALTGHIKEEFTSGKAISFNEIIHSDDRQIVWDEIQKAIKKGKHYQIEYRIRTKEGEEKWVWEQGNAVIDSHSVVHLEGFITDITDNRMRDFQTHGLISIGNILRNTVRRSDFSQNVLEKIQELFHTRSAAILTMIDREYAVRLESATGTWESFIGKEMDVKDCISYKAIKENKIIIYDRNSNQKKLCQGFASEISRFKAIIPLYINKKVLGMLVAGRDDKFTDRDVDVFKTIADMVASALERTNLYHRTEKQLKRLESLHAIDQAITAINDIQVVNKIILEQVCKELEPDAANILILNSATNVLEYFGAVGFMDAKIRDIRIPLTTSIAGKVLLENKGYAISDLEQDPLWFIRKNMQVENFKAYFASPLSIKGQAIGVLEVFFRKCFNPDGEWQNFFEVLATQAAVAYDSFRKFSELQKIQQNMVSSFRSTIETWSKSLELHDIESHGHIRRVTNETLKLAKDLGISDLELPNIERGALLHDIGKIGIMDEILLKKGALSEEEWGEIKRHPTIARDLLSNVKLLEDAMDIPYSHHENWDGSGYPQGVKGENIPLSARIFAVVETYDALISDRPYRKAWSHKEAIEYLIEQKGKKFDPVVVDRFLSIIHKPEE